MIEYLSSAQFKTTVITFIAALAVLLLIDSLVKKYSAPKSGNKGKYIVVLNIWRVIRIILIIIIGTEILAINGIHMGRYVAGLGIASAIAGFALQDPIKDIIVGISILFEGYFKIGDVVVYNGEIGKVVAFNIKTTWIFMIEDEKTVIVSNRNISEIARASDWIDVDIPIGYDIDLHFSRALCREAAKRIERLRYVYSCDFLNTQNLAESWIEYRLRIHCLPEMRYVVRRNANAVIQDVFYEHNTEFPLSIKVLYNVDPDKNNNIAAAPDDAKVVQIVSSRKKTDYELGKGAAKSKICLIDGSNNAVVKAMNEAERYATAENLGNKMKIRMRLLSEEVISMTNILTDIDSGEFYIQREGTDYEICFDADAAISSDVHDKLVSVSSSGTNEAYEGISGIIKKAVDSMVMRGRHPADSDNDDTQTAMDRSILKTDDDLRWSFNIYKEKEKTMSSETAGNRIEGDPAKSLEMSVLSRFSDDIKIAVRANHVNIRILVKNIDEE